MAATTLQRPVAKILILSEIYLEVATNRSTQFDNPHRCL